MYRFDGSLPTATDDALELASYMQSPSAGAAIIGGWSAIEGLLIRPGDGQYYQAADGLAALVTCSLRSRRVDTSCPPAHARRQ